MKHTELIKSSYDLEFLTFYEGYSGIVLSGEWGYYSLNLSQGRKMVGQGPSMPMGDENSMAKMMQMMAKIETLNAMKPSERVAMM